MFEKSPFSPESSSKKADAREKFEQFEETYQYRDADGGLICTARAAYHNEAEGDGQPEKFLDALILESPTGSEVDVLEVAKAGDVRIKLDPSRRCGIYFPEYNLVELKYAPAHPIELATLLHELGHADQYREEAYDEIAKVSPGRLNQLSDWPLEKLKARVRNLGPEFDRHVHDYVERVAKGKEGDERKKELQPMLMVLDQRIIDELEPTLMIRGKFRQLLDEVDQRFGSAASAPDEETLASFLEERFSELGFRIKARGKSRLTQDDLKELERFDLAFDKDAPQVGWGVSSVLTGSVEYDPSQLTDRLHLSYACSTKPVASRREYYYEVSVDFEKGDIPADSLERVEQLVKEYDDTLREMESLKVHGRHLDLLDRERILSRFVYLATKIQERDATRRALLWMREIKRRSGINLFAKAMDPEEAFSEEGKKSVTVGACEQDIEASYEDAAKGEVVTNVISHLDEALKTHKAEFSRMKKDYGGKVPHI